MGNVDAAVVIDQLPKDRLPDALIAAIRTQASALGANGVRIVNVFTSPARGPEPHAIRVHATGKAFRVTAPREGELTLYRKAPPGAFEVLGDIEARGSDVPDDDRLPDPLVAKLRSDAAKLGAKAS